MKSRDFSDYLDVYESNGFEKRHKLRSKPKLDRVRAVGTLVEPGTNTEGGFNPSMDARKHERAWLLEYLTPFYDELVITDVVKRLKGGKEATVYVCAAHPSTGYELIAAKVYRPRQLRNLKNDSQYRAGRLTLDEQGKGLVRGRRAKVAMLKKTKFGQELRHGSWLGHEYETLTKLHAVGADVPKPIARGDNVILMEYLGDLEMGAPALNEVELERAEAQPLFDQLMRNVALMLSESRIHGDLSAYNVLYWEGLIKIIDFPQAVDPFVNPDARILFQRDVERLCQYFARYGVRANAAELAQELWADAMHEVSEQSAVNSEQSSVGSSTVH
jgi:RIO kinase 1